jgi:hypothetical protein
VIFVPKCYFCNGECDGNLNLIINNKILIQSELFRANMCNDCYESVTGALVLLKHFTPKKENKND